MKKLCFIFLIPIFMWSQNLNELVELSLKNRLVDSYNYELESLKNEFESVKSGYLPKVDVGASYSQTNKETANVANEGSTTYATASFILYDGGKRSDTFKSYDSNIKSTEEAIQANKNKIALNVVNYYFSYLSLLSSKEAKEKEIEQLNAQYNRLKKYLDVGTTTEDELEKIIYRVESANVSLHEIELQLQTIVHNLNYITGVDVSIESGSLLNEFSQLQTELTRADIKSLEYDLDTLLNNANIEKSGYLPTINLKNTYTKYDMNYKNSSYDSTLDDQNIASINLTWNIFSFGETKNRYESQYKKYLSLKSKYMYEKNKANVDLQLAIKAYDIAKLKVKSAQSGLAAANSAYKVVKSKFENGLIDNIAYLESLTEKYNAISVLKTAQYDIEIKKANVIYNSGNNLKEYIK
ncbi:MAG: TolC family protein [Arcobacter sp.]|nr:MAG: TolC family protein [Arcobacter sp.]